ncbi:aldose epimerase family protein [Rheinheimera sp.]|uniref:aldose epimerase family protein n=1 Tax=Rheinheimera sp. TaxID=1869214 RepID=UPI00307DB6B9
MSAAFTPIRLTDGAGLELELLPFGASIQRIRFHGTEVTVGYSDPAAYQHNPFYLGSTVGRFANRIAKGQFSLNSQHYQLPVNNGPNHLHGGPDGWHQRHWRVLDQKADSALLYLCAEDGENGYPGTVEVWQRIVLQQGEVRLLFKAQSSKATPLSLTNHSYFNLNSSDAPVGNHQLQIFSDQYLPTTAEAIPTGEIATVAGTAFDWTLGQQVAQALAAEHPQLELARGFDHSYVWPNWQAGQLPQRQARLYSPESGIAMELWSDLPAVQLYTGNYLDSPFAQRQGLCLEAQHWPDAPNQPLAPSAILWPGELYQHCISFRFSQQQ